MFNKLKLSEETLKALEKLGITEPTKIQEKTIPLIIDGKDVFGRSCTGTGKTFAFALPAIELIDKDLSKNQILIVLPTRELAMQVAIEIRKITEHRKGYGTVCVYGGSSMERQIQGIKTAKIVIGTPGRLMDHIRRGTLKLNDIKLVVLDEADEMLSMGFKNDIETILESVSKERQTIMFSATMSSEIKAITKNYMNEPEYIEIGDSYSTIENIEQSYIKTPQDGKIDALLEIYKTLDIKSSLMFCNTKAQTVKLMDLLNNEGYSSLALNGDMRQSQRKKVMDKFKAHGVVTLIATDVAARGIDVKDLEYIINYDLPRDVEYYIHRIGRTGRAGKCGKAISLAKSRDDMILINRYRKVTKSEIVENSIFRKDNDNTDNSEIGNRKSGNKSNNKKKYSKKGNDFRPKKDYKKSDEEKKLGNKSNNKKNYGKKDNDFRPKKDYKKSDQEINFQEKKSGNKSNGNNNDFKKFHKTR
jgi:ATP-dependent RNA helicase DeaD